MCESGAEDQKKQLRAMSAIVPAAVADSTVIIVGANAPIVRHLGSGTLFRVADMSFVVTAAHVPIKGVGFGLSSRVLDS